MEYYTIAPIPIPNGIFKAELPFPPSLSKQYGKKGNKTFLSIQGKIFRNEVLSIIRNPPLLKGRVHITAFLYPPEKRRRDIDNFDGKALWDALTAARVWKDDHLVYSRYSIWKEPTRDGKVLVEIIY